MTQQEAYEMVWVLAWAVILVLWAALAGEFVFGG